MPNDHKSLNDKNIYSKQLGQLFFSKNIIQFYTKFNFKWFLWQNVCKQCIFMLIDFTAIWRLQAWTQKSMRLKLSKNIDKTKSFKNSKMWRSAEKQIIGKSQTKSVMTLLSHAIITQFVFEQSIFMWDCYFTHKLNNAQRGV